MVVIPNSIFSNFIFGSSFWW